MVETPPRATAPMARAGAFSRQASCAVAAAAIAAAVWAVNVCMSETPTAEYSFCGTCREAARASLYGAAAWAVMVLVDARVYPNGGSKAVWQFAVGRSAHAELHLEYDGKEAFDAPRGNRVSGRDKPYWL